jgi:hypothetical protein
MSHINIHNNADILNAVPAVLGFTPDASIVVLLLHDVDGHTAVRNGLRFDINTHAARQLTTVAAPAFANITAAILVAVCGDPIADHAAATLDIVRDSLAELNITTLNRLVTTSLDHPGQWTDLDTGDRGPVTPFRDSVIAAETVFAGHHVAASRDQIVAEFTPTTNPAPLLTTAPADFLVDTFETIAAIISGSDHPGAHPDLATRVGILIANVHLRDTMLVLSADHPGPAARLWTRLANQLTGPARMDSLTVAAACYYAASDTIRAGIALDTSADEATAHHLDNPRLAQMLHTALQAGISPTQIRAVIATLATREPH